MVINNFFEELKEGLKETAKYLFSHHEPKEYYKCYLFGTDNTKIHFCSRCLGIYLGILFGLLIYLNFNLSPKIFYFFITIFPLFALADWFRTNKKIYLGNNFLRSFSGFFLGIAYIWGIFLFFKNFPDYYLTFIFFIYILIVIFLLFPIKNSCLDNNSKREVNTNFILLFYFPAGMIPVG